MDGLIRDPTPFSTSLLLALKELCFLNQWTLDASNQVKDANLLFCLLDEVVEEVGVQNVVQVITNNA
jgi:hypothetical protein